MPETLRQVGPGSLIERIEIKYELWERFPILDLPNLRLLLLDPIPSRSFRVRHARMFVDPRSRRAGIRRRIRHTCRSRSRYMLPAGIRNLEASKPLRQCCAGTRLGGLIRIAASMLGRPAPFRGTVDDVSTMHIFLRYRTLLGSQHHMRRSLRLLSYRCCAWDFGQLLLLLRNDVRAVLGRLGILDRERLTRRIGVSERHDCLFR